MRAAAAALRIHELVHRGQPLERVLAVEDARGVGSFAIDEQRTAPEAAVDRRAADEHRIGQPALVELLHAQWHLLGRRHEQCRQADRVGPDLFGFLDDRVDRDLLAEVVDRVAVVRENRVDQRLPDVVDVAVHGRQHDLALGVVRGSLEELLEVRTARFMTSALCSTNGRMSSPAPNLSPTSFIAGSSTSLSTRTGCSRTPAASSSASIPSFLRCTIDQ